MSSGFSLPTTLIKSNINNMIITDTTTTIRKRSICALTKQQDHDWPVCKRPRHISTPSSAISVVTAEEELVSSTHNPLIDYHISSPTYTIDLSTPITHPDFEEDLPLESPSYSPPSHTTDDYSLRSDDQIVADVDNSFATGHTGAVAWNNEMLIQVLTNDIEDLCFINDRNASAGVTDEYHNFFSQYKQPFELEFYIRRLVQYSNCSTAGFVIMLVYLDRIQEKCKQLLVTDMNCHRLLCTALVLAIKYLDDEVFSNSYYARVGGVTGDEMNELELKLLNILDWNLSVSPETFSLYEDGLIESASGLSQDESIPCSPTSAA